MRRATTFCSSACSFLMPTDRHPLHPTTAMDGIWASPSRLTCVAEHSRKHQQTLDIHAPRLAEKSLEEKVMAISLLTPQRMERSECLEALLQWSVFKQTRCVSSQLSIEDLSRDNICGDKSNHITPHKSRSRAHVCSSPCCQVCRQQDRFFAVFEED